MPDIVQRFKWGQTVDVYGGEFTLDPHGRRLEE
jgi:hypothetical protein